MAMKTYTNTMLTIIAGVRIKGGSTSFKRSRRARGATRLAGRRLGANSACRSDLSAETSERLLGFMTFSTFPVRCQRDHVAQSAAQTESHRRGTDPRRSL